MSQSDTKLYDLIIIGGGISGIGAGLEAQKKGYKTLIVEKHNLFHAASSNNLRIIHAGYRYLQTLSFQRIIQSVLAQKTLLETYPQYIKSLPCIFPLQGSGMKSALPVTAANFIYNLLCRVCGKKSMANTVLSREQAEKEVPLLKGKVNFGALKWYDAKVENLNAFHQKLLEEYTTAGGSILTAANAEEVSENEKLLSLKINLNGKAEILNARYIINTGGAWIDQFQVNIPGFKRPAFKWCKAFNIILNKQIEKEYAIGIESTDKNKVRRLYFLVPRDGKTVIGTGYTESNANPSMLSVSKEEIEDIIRDINQALPELALKTSDLEATEAGVLPYLSEYNGTFKLQGSELIYNFSNYFEVLSTKYTTFQSQSARLIKMLPNIK